eukprot:TRINITY_DN7047_c1_g3_i1.p1 TRINITY_DN7047_c1_g3~~TRINITY_DN7047_c1_g3_i1.p1  ORF type:complete len:636 (-),score=111.32 TRINITY_DN7047_c1_g3_i1:45-1952(-)
MAFQNWLQTLSVLLVALAGISMAQSEDGDGGEKEFAEIKADLLADGRPSSNFGDSLVDPIKEADVERVLENIVGVSSSNVQRARLAKAMAALRPIFTALPKDKQGLLSYQTSRYAIHRWMMQEHGWFIRVLEPSEEASMHKKRVDSEWVPSYVEGQVLKRSGALGVSLSDLATMAATIEDLIFVEIRKKFKAVYIYLGMSTSEPVEKQLVHCAMDAFVFYIMTFDLLQARANLDPYWLSADVSIEGRRESICRPQFMTRLLGYRPEVRQWSSAVLDAVGDSPDGKMSFSQAISFAFSFIADLAAYNDVDCQGLKATLVELEGLGGANKTGRITVNMYHDRQGYKYWPFMESAEQLREASILDDEVPGEPTIILSNYIGSRLNCVESSSLYAVCCKIECDSLLSSLEMKLAAATGTADEIASFVATLPSSSVSLPEISPERLAQLKQLQAAHHGRVPIYSEAFAMWMHNVYPRECPQPHPDRSATFPMTAGEWFDAAAEEYWNVVVENDAQYNARASSDDPDFANTKTWALLLVSLLCSIIYFSLRSQGPVGSALQSGIVNLLGQRGVSVIKSCSAAAAAFSASFALIDGIRVSMVLIMIASIVSIRLIFLNFQHKSQSRQKLASCYDDVGLASQI